MNCQIKKRKIFFLVFLFTSVVPVGVYADVGGYAGRFEVCSKYGYTIATINGINTTESQAEDNKDALRIIISDSFNGEKVDFTYFYNPTHLKGVWDLADSTVEKISSDQIVSRGDFIEMLQDASARVKTQKLLLVAHSEGNFYANKFYDKMVVEKGIIPAQSIGVYGIANPSNRVAGGGISLTSKSDIINIVPLNKESDMSVKSNNRDDLLGHDFIKIYIGHFGEQMKKDIDISLKKLLPNSVQIKPYSPCIPPQETGVLYKIFKPIVWSADKVTNLAVDGIVSDAKGLWWVAGKTADVLTWTGTKTAEGIWWAEGKIVDGAVVVADKAADAAVWTYNKGVDAAVGTYNTGKAAVNKGKKMVTDTYDTLVNLPDVILKKGSDFVEQKQEEATRAVEKKMEEAAEEFARELERELERQCAVKAAYASSENEDLTTLREFRDNTLNKNDVGRLLVKEYYKNSPPIAEYLSEHKIARELVKNAFFVPVTETIRLLKN